MHIVFTQVHFLTFCNSMIPIYTSQTTQILKGLLPSGKKKTKKNPKNLEV